MAEGTTEQYAQPQQQQQPIVVIPVANPSQNESAPFLVNESNEMNEGNHNDPQLLNQTTVFNLNNHNVRMTFWSIVYMLLTTQVMQTASSGYIDDTGDDYYSLLLSANNVLWWAAALILLNLYCVCCTCKCTKCSAFLFIAGGILSAVNAGKEIHDDCVRDDWDVTNAAEKGYCKVSYISGWCFVVLFSFYLAVDAVNSIGNNIQTRICVKAGIIGIRSFLQFLVYLYVDKHPNNYDDGEPNGENYSISTLISANFGLFFWCSCALLVVANGYGKQNGDKKLNICFKRIMGWFIIGCTGTSMGFPSYVNYFWLLTSESWTGLYYVVGAAVLVYDLQYL